VNDPYLTADAFVGMVEKWSGMPNTHLSQGDAIEYRQHVSKVDGSTVKALFIPFTSKQAAFFGFNVTLETGMVQHPNPETTHASFMELYHEFDGLHEWIQEKTRAFNHITFFGENTGGLMAQLARMKASEFQESQESQESTSKKQFHLTAFMEKSRYLRALPEFFPKNDVLKNDEDVCKYTRIHGMPLVNTWSMKKSFVDINPCAGYEQTFKVKMTDPIKLALVGGTSGVLAAAGLLLAADPSGLTLTIVGGSVGLYAGWKLMWSEGKGKKSDVLFGELPTERKPQAHINSN
jgi:desulfoferrodoxin (superoxide reductase-like protein)